MLIDYNMYRKWEGSWTVRNKHIKYGLNAAKVEELIFEKQAKASDGKSPNVYHNAIFKLVPKWHKFMNIFGDCVDK